MKQFTIIKVGYTKGIYGCSNEFFTCVYVNDDGINSFSFKGLYGAEQRVARILTNKGYEEKYTSSDFGKMTAKEVAPIFKNEGDAEKLAETL